MLTSRIYDTNAKLNLKFYGKNFMNYIKQETCVEEIIDARLITVSKKLFILLNIKYLSFFEKQTFIKNI